MWLKKKARVIMLPTNEKANIWLNKFSDQFHLDKELKENHKDAINHHLYILSDEEIKEGDWVYNESANKILKFEDSFDIGTNYKRFCKKIIATTDTSLKIECQGCRFHRNNSSVIYTCSCQYLPQPSKQFIEKYIESYNSGNIITEVMVEYEGKTTPTGMNICTCGFHKGKDGYLICIGRCKNLKINPKDNTITISKCKDSWSKDEIEEIIWNYKNYLNTQNETVFGDTDNWIEENL